ncbi:MAG TPA: hypothetical protein VFA70_06315 [Dehalococcoidia bacterium]|nr:hypothetical protein [Dehalococcoidia bacterium]
MTPYVILVAGTADWSARTMTLTANLYDLDQSPRPYQVDGSGAPLWQNGVIGAYTPVAPLPPPLAIVVGQFPVDLPDAQVEAAMQTRARDTLQRLLEEQHLQQRLAYWQQIFVPVPL